MHMLPLVVTTRLGVKFADRPLLEPVALDERIDLLRTTSARTIEALAHVCAAWVIQTHVEHVDHIEEAIRQRHIPVPDDVRVQVIARSERGFEQVQLDRLDVPGRYLCLRLDSDDQYLATPVEIALRRFSAAPEGTLVDFPRGYLVDLASKQAKRFGYSVQGPFYGVVAGPRDPLPAIGHHGGARNGRRCVEQLERSWIQTVNDSNIFTVYRRAGPVEEARGMVGQIRRARGQRPILQLAIRPFDLVPMTAARKRALVERVT